MNFSQRINRVGKLVDEVAGVRCHYCGGSHGKSNLTVAEFTQEGDVVETWRDVGITADNRCKFCGGDVEMIPIDADRFVLALAAKGTR